MTRGRGRPRITPEQARERLAPLAEGVTVKELCARLGVSDSTVYYWAVRAGMSRGWRSPIGPPTRLPAPTTQPDPAPSPPQEG